MGNKEAKGKTEAKGVDKSIQLVLERPEVCSGGHLRGMIIVKLDNVYAKLNLDEIVLNLVGFERFSFVR